MAASDASRGSEVPRQLRVFGIDPGAVNTGLCEYDATHDRALSLERVQFRAKGTGGDDAGQARLIKSVVSWIEANLARFRDAIIFIENQPPDAYGYEGQAVQHAFQTVFLDRCRPVLPESVKQRYAEFFPRHPKYYDFDIKYRKRNQHAHDKRSAIVAGRMHVPQSVREEYEKKNPTKKDDAYDAYWIARYGADHLLKTDGTLRDKPEPAPRLKKGEVHARGRAKRTTTTSKTSTSKPKPKAKAKASGKAETKSKKRKAESSDGDDSDYIDLTQSAAPKRKQQRKD